MLNEGFKSFSLTRIQQGMADFASSSHKGKKIQSYSLAFKLKVIEFAKKENNMQASKVFGVDRKRVIEWRKAETDLKSIGQATKRRGFLVLVVG